MAKVFIALSAKAGKSSLEAWAKDYWKRVNAISKCAPIELCSQDGVWMSKKKGRRILADFKKEKPYEQITDFYLIESPDDESVGLSLDFRKEMTDGPNLCIVQFYRKE